MATLSYDIPNQLITVDLPDTEVLVQEIWDQSAVFLSSFQAMSTPNFMFAGGKDDLGGGLLSAISLTLIDWKIGFAARPGPSTVTTDIQGGNVVGRTGSVTGPTQDPIEQAAFTFIKLARSTDGVLINSQALNDVSDQLLGRSVIDPATPGRVGDWIERHYDPTDDVTETYRYELRDMAGVLITDSHNPVADPTVIIAQRIPIAVP